MGHLVVSGQKDFQAEGLHSDSDSGLEDKAKHIYRALATSSTEEAHLPTMLRSSPAKTKKLPKKTKNPSKVIKFYGFYNKAYLVTHYD
jgi:hypothetical protein